MKNNTLAISGLPTLSAELLTTFLFGRVAGTGLRLAMDLSAGTGSRYGVGRACRPRIARIDRRSRSRKLPSGKQLEGISRIGRPLDQNIHTRRWHDSSGGERFSGGPASDRLPLGRAGNQKQYLIAATQAARG